MAIPEVQRDTCYLCGNPHKELLETHHIVPSRFNGSDGPRNLVDVCPTCHRKLERLYNDRFYEQMREYFKKELTADNLVESDIEPPEEDPPQYTKRGKRQRNLKAIVADLAEDNDMGAPIDRVISEHPAPDEDVREHLEKLATKGEVYEANDGHLRAT